MLRHTILLIYRNFKRFKTTFFINLIGLSSGLACTLLIYLWVNDELQVDKFHVKDDRLYRVMEHRLTDGGIWTALTAPGPMGESLAAEMPEVEYAINSSPMNTYTLSVDEKNMQATGRFAGKDFFNMFSYELVQGNENQVLSDKNSIVISDELALKLFDTVEDVVGKSVELDHKEVFQISGIFKKVPASSSEQFDFVGSFEKAKEWYWNSWLQYWGNTGTFAFVLLKPNADVNTFNAKIADYIKVKSKNNITHRTPFLKKYSDHYLHGKYDENGVQSGGRITYVRLFSTIAVFILIIACINFMNLSTAKASGRIKEVGIKKAIGAGRKTLILQYLGESLLMSFLSLLAAILIVDLFLPKFNLITGKDLVLHLEKAVIIPAVAIAVFTGILAGSYPALFISGFSPASVLKGRINTSFGEVWARKGLVIFQFALSVILIVSVLVVYKQVEFVQSKYLGYDKDNMIYFPLVGELSKTVHQESFLNEMKNLPGIVNASSTSNDMTGHNSGTNGIYWEGKDPDDRTEFENFTVNYGMIETLGMEMATGRTFSKAYSTDTAKIIFNEAGIAFMGLKDPIGKTVKLWGKDRQIVGVIKNFHFESLHKKINPAFFRLDADNTYLVMGKISAGQEQETIARIEQLYRKFNPGFPFTFEFLDEEYKALYAAEQRVAALSKYFAGLAILISCLGLLGLAAFSAERRFKEIGIRKVLGSSELGIIYLLSSDFTKLALVAIIIALPLSYLMTQLWLEGFEFRIALEWWYFMSAGVTAMVIALLTVGTQAFKAARVNPVRCLRNE
ncbi:MAG: ABC transporter permease [Cyclobacteriaceae bacterium]